MTTTISMSEVELQELRHKEARVGMSSDVTVDETETKLEPVILTPDGASNRSLADLEPSGRLRAYGVVVGSFLGLMANFGVINSIGVIQAYVSTHQLADVRTSTISWVFSIYLYLSFAIGIFTGPLFVMHGSLPPLLAGTVLISGGFMAASECQKVWQFILSFLCIGTGHALSITPLVGVISQHWSQAYIGRASSIATIGGSMGGVVWPLMLRGLYPKVGFAWTTRILGFFCLGCMLCGVLLARERYCRNIFIFESDNDKVLSKRKKLQKAGKKLLSFGALRDLKYTFVIAGTFFGELSLILVTTYYASYAITQGMSETSSYLLLTIFNACGILGRWIPGHLADMWGPFNVMILTLILLTLTIFVLWLPFGSHVGVLYAFAATFGGFSGSIFSLLPAALATIPVYDVKKVPQDPNNPFTDSEDVVREIKSPLEFGQKYGLLYFFVSIGNLVGIPLASAVIGNGSKHNYDMFVLLNGVLMLVSVICWSSSRYFIVGREINIKV